MVYRAMHNNGRAMPAMNSVRHQTWSDMLLLLLLGATSCVSREKPFTVHTGWFAVRWSLGYPVVGQLNQRFGVVVG